MTDDRPTKAPLCQIVKWNGRVSAHSDRLSCTLECGHTISVKGPMGRRRSTRCYACLEDARVEWDTAHMCPHGNIGECWRCELEQNRAEIERLREALMQIAQLASRPCVVEIARDALGE